MWRNIHFVTSGKRSPYYNDDVPGVALKPIRSPALRSRWGTRTHTHTLSISACKRRTRFQSPSGIFFCVGAHTFALIDAKPKRLLGMCVYSYSISVAGAFFCRFVFSAKQNNIFYRSVADATALRLPSLARSHSTTIIKCMRSIDFAAEVMAPRWRPSAHRSKTADVSKHDVDIGRHHHHHHPPGGL